LKLTLLNISYLKSRFNYTALSKYAYLFFYGVIGFLSFFSVIILAKFYKYIFDMDELITIDELDILLSATGFIMLIIFKKFKNM
jgi:hypothetical protein